LPEKVMHYTLSFTFAALDIKIRAKQKFKMLKKATTKNGKTNQSTLMGPVPTISTCSNIHTVMKAKWLSDIPVKE
jgi:hypothetical protein